MPKSTKVVVRALLQDRQSSFDIAVLFLSYVDRTGQYSADDRPEYCSCKTAVKLSINHGQREIHSLKATAPGRKQHRWLAKRIFTKP